VRLQQTNGYLRLRLMRLVKKVRVTVEASESFREKLVKTMRKDASCCRTSCIYRGEDDQSFSIRSSSESKMTCTNKAHEGRYIHQKKVGKINVKEE
nr:hypothetical protein [Tanacetum cinerariifolium]